VSRSNEYIRASASFPSSNSIWFSDMLVAIALGLIFLIIGLIYWRLFIPLGIVLALAFVSFVFLQKDTAYEKRSSHSGDRYQAEDKADSWSTELAQRVKNAKTNASLEGKSWQAHLEKDPASHIDVVRAAKIMSDDELCEFWIHKPLDEDEYSKLVCAGFNFVGAKEITIKFDYVSHSEKMAIDGRAGGELRIPVEQPYWGLDYRKFIQGLTSGTAVALKVPILDGVWIRFSLEGSAPIIDSLGNATEG
jgi:membrane protein implicated in regulation of membrane protease activity